MKSSTNLYKLLAKISWISWNIALPGKRQNILIFGRKILTRTSFFFKFLISTKSLNLYINRRRIMRRIDLCTMFMCFIASFKNNLRKQILLTVGQAGSRLAISKTPFLLNYCCSLLILTHIFKESRVLEILV